MAGKFVPFEKSKKDAPKGMKEKVADKKPAGKKTLPAFMVGKKR